MRLSNLLVSAALFASLSVVAFAQQPAPAAPAATVKANAKAKPAEKMICRREAPAVGTIIVKKTCMTKSEWDAKARADEYNAEKARNTTKVLQDSTVTPLLGTNR